MPIGWPPPLPLLTRSASAPLSLAAGVSLSDPSQSSVPPEPSAVLVEALRLIGVSDDDTAVGILSGLAPSELRCSPPPDRISLLHVAAMGGLARTCAALIAAGADVGGSDAFGLAPLHYAAHGEHAAVAAMLLEAKAPADAAGPGGCTALMIAVEREDATMATALLRAPCSLSCVDEFGRSALACAVERSAFGLLRLLAFHGAVWSQGDLLRTEAGWHRRRAERELQLGATLLVLGIRDAVGPASLPDAPLGSALIELKDAKGITMLHACSLKGFGSLAHELLSLGAAPDAKDELGMTPLMYAVIAGEEAAARVLIDAGASVNTPRQDGSTPAHEAAKLGAFDMMKLLACAGADIDAQDAEGFTPLHMAVQNGQEKMATLLVVLGAQRNQRTYNGLTIQEIAQRSPNQQAAEVTAISLTGTMLDSGLLRPEAVELEGVDLSWAAEVAKERKRQNASSDRGNSLLRRASGLAARLLDDAYDIDAQLVGNAARQDLPHLEPFELADYCDEGCQERIERWQRHMSQGAQAVGSTPPSSDASGALPER